MTTDSNNSVSRRTALAGLGAGGLGLAMVATVRGASTQDATPDATATHPIVGVWLGYSPDISIAAFHPDGSANWGIFPNYMDPARGVVFQSPGVGTWEPTGPRSAHFTAISLETDANGTYLGSGTVDGYPLVSEDGETLSDDNSQVVITIRDATGAITQQFSGAGAPPVTGNRMRTGAPVFNIVPVATPTS